MTARALEQANAAAGMTGGGLERLLLTPEEAAQVLGITRSTVYELLRLRLLRSVKIGKKYRRIPMSTCRELVDRLLDESVA